MSYIFWLVVVAFVFYKFSNFFAKFWLAFVAPLLGKVSKSAEDVINKSSTQAGIKLNDDQVDEVRK